MTRRINLKDTSIVFSNTINPYCKYERSKRPEVVVNRFPENLHNFKKKCTILGEKRYKEDCIVKTNANHTNNIAILGDSIVSILRGIKSEFSKTLRSGRARFKRFPVASTKQLLHHIDPTLDEQNFEAAIIHTGINDSVYDSSSWQTNVLLRNINEKVQMLWN